MNQEKIRGLMDKYCNGNYNRFARELGCDPAHIYRFLTTGKGGGKKIVLGLINFCTDKGLNFQEYIQ